MAYGVQLRTQNGLTSVENIRTLQTVYSYATTSSAGSFSAPAGLSASNAVLIAEVHDGKTAPYVYWNSTTVTWGGAAVNPSVDLTIHILRFA